MRAGKQAEGTVQGQVSDRSSKAITRAVVARECRALASEMSGGQVWNRVWFAAGSRVLRQIEEEAGR